LVEAKSKNLFACLKREMCDKNGDISNKYNVMFSKINL
jgi:hypothetical protein